MLQSTLKTVAILSVISLSPLSYASPVLMGTTTASRVFTSPSTPTKTYQLLNVENVVANASSCQTVYQSLKTLEKKTLSFQFISNNTDAPIFKLNDQAGLIQNHNYTIMQQRVNGSVVSRVGMGDFMLNQHPIQYVVVITADTSQKNFKYIYPLILTSNNSHCHFTALLEPDTNTTATFKKNISNGTVSSKNDLVS